MRITLFLQLLLYNYRYEISLCLSFQHGHVLNGGIHADGAAPNTTDQTIKRNK